MRSRLRLNMFEVSQFALEEDMGQVVDVATFEESGGLKAERPRI